MFHEQFEHQTVANHGRSEVRTQKRRIAAKMLQIACQMEDSSSHIYANIMQDPAGKQMEGSSFQMLQLVSQMEGSSCKMLPMACETESSNYKMLQIPMFLGEHNHANGVNHHFYGLKKRRMLCTCASQSLSPDRNVEHFFLNLVDVLIVELTCLLVKSFSHLFPRIFRYPPPCVPRGRG